MSKSFFESVFQKFFSKSGEEIQMNHTENIHFSENEISILNEWMESSEFTLIKQTIKKSFDLSRLNLDNDLDLMLYQTPYANGIYFVFPAEFSLTDKKHIALACKEILLKNGYMLYRAVKETDFKNQRFKKTDKYYLKPNIEFDENGLMKQRFGNITIEVECNETDYVSFKLLANIYSDRNYKPYESFQELMMLLFSE